MTRRTHNVGHQTFTNPPNALLAGGIAAWQLPVDTTCALTSRSVLKSALTPLLPPDLVGDVVLMASELCANAQLHGLAHERRADGSASLTACPPEIWAYTRVRPTTQLMIKVYDPWPEWTEKVTEPRLRAPDELIEDGRGLDLVKALSTECGWHRTLSRLAPAPVHGKAVYFVVHAAGLPSRAALPFIPPREAARVLYEHLATRGIGDLQLSHGEGRSLVSLPCGFTVWAENPGRYRWQDPTGHYRHRPYIDLIDVTEITVQRHVERVIRPC